MPPLSSSGPQPAAGPPVEEKGHPRSDGPAHRPGAPYAQGGACPAGQEEGQDHPQDQIRERGDHELPHGAGAPQDSVRHQLHGHHKVERGQDPQKLPARLQCRLRAPVHEKQQQIPAERHIGNTEGHAQAPHQPPACPEALPDPPESCGPQVLGREIGYPVADGGKGGDHQVVQLHRRGISGGHTDPEAVYPALDQHVPHRDEGLLQDAGDGHYGYLSQQAPGEDQNLRFRPDVPQPLQHQSQRQDAACPLAEECGPGHACDSHGEALHEEDVDQDIGRGGQGQEEEGRPGVPQGREDACGDIVKEQEGQPPDIDVQVQGGIRHDLRLGLHQPQQCVAGGEAPKHQRGAEDAAGNQRRIDRGFHGPVVLRPEELGYDDRASDIAAEGKGDKDEGDVVAVPHRRQCPLADKLPCYQRIRYVVKLLEHDAAEHGQAECPQHLPGLPLCQILVHDFTLPFRFSILFTFSRKPIILRKKGYEKYIYHI